MRSLRKIILAGAAAIALAGVAGLAAAEIKNVHMLDVRLADGSLAHIRYVGDTPPTVSFTSAPTAFSIPSPASDTFGPESAFAALERISEAMDRQADMMLREAAAPSAPPFIGPGMTQVDLGKLPPGADGFWMVSTISGDGVCTRSIQHRSLGDGKPPQVLTRTSGACAADPQGPALPLTAGPAAEAPQPQHAGRQPT